MAYFFSGALDEADEVIGISVVVVDITEHKRTRDALRESDDHQRHIDVLHHQVPWVMDADGNSLQVSSEWVRRSGWFGERTRNLGWLEALHPEDLDSTMKSMKSALRTGNPIDIEYRVNDIDGEWKWMRSRGSARLGTSGEIIRWYGTVEDIDERKRTVLSAVAGNH